MRSGRYAMSLFHLQLTFILWLFITGRSNKLVPCYIMINGTQNAGECSSSTSLSSQQDVDDDRMIAVVLSEEYAELDGAVGRRLSNLAPVPVRYLIIHSVFSYVTIAKLNL